MVRALASALRACFVRRGGEWGATASPSVQTSSTGAPWTAEKALHCGRGAPRWGRGHSTTEEGSTCWKAPIPFGCFSALGRQVGAARRPPRGRYMVDSADPIRLLLRLGPTGRCSAAPSTGALHGGQRRSHSAASPPWAERSSPTVQRSTSTRGLTWSTARSPSAASPPWGGRASREARRRPPTTVTVR